MHTAEHVRSARECRPCTRDDESQLSQCRTSSTDSKSLSICSFFNTRDHKDERKTVSTFVSIESGQDMVDGETQPERRTKVYSALYFFKAKPWVETQFLEVFYHGLLSDQIWKPPNRMAEFRFCILENKGSQRFASMKTRNTRRTVMPKQANLEYKIPMLECTNHVL
jgi:hypothetical protein